MRVSGSVELKLVLEFGRRCCPPVTSTRTNAGSPARRGRLEAIAISAHARPAAHCLRRLRVPQTHHRPLRRGRPARRRKLRVRAAAGRGAGAGWCPLWLPGAALRAREARRGPVRHAAGAAPAHGGLPDVASRLLPRPVGAGRARSILLDTVPFLEESANRRPPDGLGETDRDRLLRGSSAIPCPPGRARFPHTRIRALRSTGPSPSAWGSLARSEGCNLHMKPPCGRSSIWR